MTPPTPSSGNGDQRAPDMRQVDAPATPTCQRKLHLGHFAFMRALIQGLDTRASWNRYLRIEGEHGDTATVRKTVAWLRDEFAAAARRRQRHGAARLVLVDVAGVARDAPTLPSLADFIAERGIDDFSEAEQLAAYAAYHAEHGNATGRGSRRARLMHRQLETLRWLEGLIAEPPRAGDAVSAWLHPDLAARLEQAGVTTLALLIDRINGLGSGWYRALPAIGAIKAARVIDWLHAHEATLGKTVGAYTSMPKSSLSFARLQAVVPPATGIVPLEKLIVPDTLSGADGLYRLPQQRCLIQATNDLEAILAWVHAKPGPGAKAAGTRPQAHVLGPGTPDGSLAWPAVPSHTQRAYLKEAERFTLWAIVQQQKPLSSMTPEDCIAYRDFLADPQPAALWCGPRGRPRWSPLWRPFEGPLSASAQRRAIAILKSLYSFLADQCYLQCSPLASMKLPAQSRSSDSGRRLSPALWAFVQAEAHALPHTSANQRLKFTLILLYGTGLRISEAHAARMADLACRLNTDRAHSTVEAWDLSIAGVGGKKRRVPVPSAVIDELQAYLVSRGLPAALSAVAPETFLIGRAVDVKQRASWSPAARNPVDRLSGISTATLHDQIKRFFGDCARKISTSDPRGAETLGQASAHWMRHSDGIHAVETGVGPKPVQRIPEASSPFLPALPASTAPTAPTARDIVGGVRQRTVWGAVSRDITEQTTRGKPEQ